MSEPPPVDAAAWPVPADAVVAEWLQKAAKDLDRMEQHVARGMGSDPDDICFHAQQAVEKTLKAALIACAVSPPYTHELIELSSLLQSRHPAWSWPREDLRVLALGAVHFRYPGMTAREDEARDAVFAARRIVAALRRFF